ncbi:hypothetical protein ABEB36_000148 [Hypothenemus hampei]|uniref:Uncharacterized protein n=1 Tax=Hypothenemus hampei TaxID=57062 RepID=A0ABD1FAD2_HYPHA
MVSRFQKRRVTFVAHPVYDLGMYENEQNEVEVLNINDAEVITNIEGCEALDSYPSTNASSFVLENETTTSKKSRTENSTAAVAKSITDTGSTVKSVLEIYKSQKSVVTEDREDEMFGQMVISTLKRKKNRKQKKELKKKIFLCLMDDSDNE